MKEYQRKHGENSEISWKMKNIDNTDITLQVEITVKKKKTVVKKENTYKPSKSNKNNVSKNERKCYILIENKSP